MAIRKFYKDTIHGFEAGAHSKEKAHQLISGLCRFRSLQVPTIDQIVEVSDTTTADSSNSANPTKEQE